MRRVFATLLLSAALAAQAPDQAGPASLTRELRTAIQDDSLSSAAEIAARLDDAVHAQYQAWLIRDSRQRVDEVLSWLPAETEALWVSQEPFVVSPEALYDRPVQAYSLDRLMALDDGRFYRALANQTVRLVVAATQGAREPQAGIVSIPRPMPPQDVAYFYFFARPVDLPSPDESVQGRPVWQGAARIDAGGPPQPGIRREERDDPNWIALPRPDLLVLTNRKELLGGILESMSGESKTRALPAVLPEWAEVDRAASFWGLRRYTTQSKPKPGERGCEAAQLPQPDCGATGVTVRFDAAQQRLEVRFLSGAQLAERGGLSSIRREFQIDQPRSGVWRLVSDVRQRGAFPVHFALIMLGFGVYQ